MELSSKSTSDTQNFAGQIAKEAINYSAPSGGALVIALEGELGAGKTTFTQGFMRSLGVSEAVKSPTFLLMKHYELDNRQIYHLDCYRINDEKELEPLEIKHILRDPKNIVIIEWPERIATLIPQDAWRIHIDHIDTEVRKISFTK